MSGATVNLSTSWDVFAHKRANMELYGTEGSIMVPDPNMFSGRIEVAGRDGHWTEVPAWDHPLGVFNSDHRRRGPMPTGAPRAGRHGRRPARGREARCSLDRALHGVEVMTACLTSGETGQFVTMTTTCTRPAALSPAEAARLMA